MAASKDVLAKKKISMIGMGRLGLCTALCFDLHGWDVLGVDVFPSYVDSINNRTLRSREPRVMELLTAPSCKLKATTDTKAAIAHSDLIMILVATPTGVGENSYDCGTLSNVLCDLNEHKIQNKHLVICCTVPPTYCDTVGLSLLRDCKNCTLSYNPEFIAQGNIIQGLLTPDMVLIGEGSKDAGDILEELYKTSTENSPRICRMSTASAEIMKLSLNCFVTTKISYANMIGDIADRTPNANKIDILTAVGSDSRVGSKCIFPGYGFGGPCFPRDNRALGVYARRVGVEPMISEATDKYNVFHADFMAKQLLNQGLDEYVISDVAYKPKCPVDIIEESQPLEVAKRLVRAGKKVTIKDRPAILELVRRTYGSIFSYEVDTTAGIAIEGAAPAPVSQEAENGNEEEEDGEEEENEEEAEAEEDKDKKAKNGDEEGNKETGKGKKGAKKRTREARNGVFAQTKRVVKKRLKNGSSAVVFTTMGNPLSSYKR